MARIGKRWKSCLSSNALTLLTVMGVFGGVALGLILKYSSETPWTQREIMYINFPGDLFLRILKALILPLIVSSIISAIASLDLNLSGKVGMRAICYYATTTVCAVVLGLLLVTSIQPGHLANKTLFLTNADLAPQRPTTTADTILDLIRNIFPPNLVKACIAQYRTILTPLYVPVSNITNTTDETASNNSTKLVSDMSLWKIDHEDADGTNTLGLVVFGIIMGITLAKMGDAGRPLRDFFNALSEAMMIITNWVIWLSPIGVTFLVASKILEIDDLGAVAGTLGMYFMTVLLGLFIHGFGTLSIIFWICTRELPFKSLGKMTQVMVTAFGTASSSATLPITLQCLDNMGVDSRISKFVVPIGATINMDGTALYEAIAAIFIGQVRNVQMSYSKIIAVSITATAASIGAAGIPQAGLVTMVMVLDTVGLPAEDVTLIIAVDWLLDRFRTTINVIGDALAAVIIEKMSREDLRRLDAPRHEEVVELTHLNKAEA